MNYINKDNIPFRPIPPCSHAPTAALCAPSCGDQAPPETWRSHLAGHSSAIQTDRQTERHTGFEMFKLYVM